MECKRDSSQEKTEDRENDQTIWRGLFHFHGISCATKGPDSENSETHTLKANTGNPYYVPSTVLSAMCALIHQSSQ